MDFKQFLEEQKEKHAVLAFGRMNPPTVGHAKLVDKVKEVAKEVGGKSFIVLSHTHDAAKNPLSPEQKVKHAQRFFPGVNITTSDKTHPVVGVHLAFQRGKQVRAVTAGNRVPVKENLGPLGVGDRGGVDHPALAGDGAARFGAGLFLRRLVGEISPVNLQRGDGGCSEGLFPRQQLLAHPHRFVIGQ